VAERAHAQPAQLDSDPRHPRLNPPGEPGLADAAVPSDQFLRTAASGQLQPTADQAYVTGVDDAQPVRPAEIQEPFTRDELLVRRCLAEIPLLGDLAVEPRAFGLDHLGQLGTGSLHGDDRGDGGVPLHGEPHALAALTDRDGDLKVTDPQDTREITHGHQHASLMPSGYPPGFAEPRRAPYLRPDPADGTPPDRG